MEHSELVRALKKDGTDILINLTPAKADLWHMTSGVVGEAGELMDAVKKYVVYGKDLDRENVKEELGDLEWYLEGIRQNMGFTRSEILEMNVAKLLKRYPGAEYTNEAAIARADKA